MKGFKNNICFNEIYKLFDGVGITREWLHCIKNGATKIYNNGYGIVNLFTLDGVLYVNSGSVDDGKFTTEMLKDLIRLAKLDGNIFIASDVVEIEPYMKKLGFIYDRDIRTYIKRR